MNLLRARVSNSGGWWELHLLDLAIMADGASEDEVLRGLEHALMAEYQLALKYKKVPFVELFRECPDFVRASWENDDGKKHRQLDLPDEVRLAIAAVFRLPTNAPFEVKTYPRHAA